MEFNSTIFCPHCATKVQLDWYSSPFFEIEDKEDKEFGKRIYYAECSDCYKLISKLIYAEVVQITEHTHKLGQVITETFLIPSIRSEFTSDLIPSNLLSEFNEAVLVIPFSPKSSAAMTRRILQTILREHYSITERTLDAEIHKFIHLDAIPSHITDAVDAVRTIGNIAAHPTKDKHTGTIVDVEPGEAEWLIEVIETLFDYTFIQPKKLEERRNNLDAKLQALGKPKLKERK